MENFKQLNLSAPILKSLEEQGFEKPTPIQAQALPVLLGEPTDFLGLAATGTGKTAAFAIPMLEKIDPKIRTVQAVILCPTRELAVQVAGQVDLLGKHMGVKSVAIYGGASYADQIRALKNGVQVVVGTPGRVVDHLGRGTLVLPNVKVLILDEADEMISMGFADEMEQILESIPKDQCRTWLFSATMNAQVSRLTRTYLNEPKQVQINRTEVLSATVEQFFYPVRESDKPEVLCKLIDAAEDFYGVIFCQTKALVTDLTQLLVEKGYKVDSLHGDKDQNAREKTLKAFRERKVRILVCTDVAARGIDVKDITHVINYSLPRELDNYVHRIGRTARSGKNGIAMNLVSPAHRRLVYAIEKFTKSRMIEGKIPTRKEVGSKKVGQLLPKFQDQPFAERAQSVLTDEWKTALAGLSTEEVAARFLAMMMPDLFNERAREATAAQAPARDSRGSYDRREPRRDRGFGGDRGYGDRRREARHDEPREPRREFRPRFERAPEDRPFRKEERSFDQGSRPAPRPAPRADDSRPVKRTRPHDAEGSPRRRFDRYPSK